MDANNLNNVRVLWLNQGGPKSVCFGVVIGEDYLGDRRAYIGVGQAVLGDGITEEEDIQYIMDWGCKLRLDIADTLFLTENGLRESGGSKNPDDPIELKRRISRLESRVESDRDQINTYAKQYRDPTGWDR